MSVGVCHGPFFRLIIKHKKRAHLGLYVWLLHSTSIYQHCQNCLAVAPCKLNDYMFDDVEDDNASRKFTYAGM